MKLSEYIEKFGDKQVDVDKLSEFIIEDKVWLPEKSQDYWYVDSFGDVHEDVIRSPYDNKRLEHQQVYRTEAEAEFARDKAIFLEFMRKEFLRNSDELNWLTSSNKYFMGIDHLENEIYIDLDWRSRRRSDFYTTDRHWLSDFIIKYNYEIKKYYFEVNDDEWLYE